MSERVKRQGRAGRCEYCEAGVRPTQSAFERWLDAELAKLQAAGWSFHEPIDPEMSKRECQHANRYAKTFTVDGVTRPITIRQWWCRDCGALISQEAL